MSNDGILTGLSSGAFITFVTSVTLFLPLGTIGGPVSTSLERTSYIASILFIWNRYIDLAYFSIYRRIVLI